jgi:DNA-binding NtrC family response regulator
MVNYLLARHREALSSEASSVSQKALEALVSYDWPGNIRQLENVIRRAMVLCNGNTINTDSLDFGPEAARSGMNVSPVSSSSATMPPVASVDGIAASSSPSLSISPNDMDDLVERLLSSGKSALIEDMERLLIGRALEKLNGNQLQTAKLLGITRNTLRSRIEKYGLRPKVKVM